MNPIVKAALLIAEQVAVTAIPGAKIVDVAVRSSIDKKDGKDIRDNAPDLAMGTIQLIEQFKGVDIADEVQFRAGVATVDAGMKLIQASLKVSPEVTVGPSK